MPLSQEGAPEPQRRLTIICPGCGRELYNLRRPMCLWCGAPIGESDYQAVAAPHRPMTDVPPSTPLNYGLPYTPWWGRGLLPATARPVAP